MNKLPSDMKIDLHVHIKRTSKCAKAEPLEMAIKAKEVGLDGLVILDHNYQASREECNSVEQETGIKLFRGCEVNVCGEDIIIISNQDIKFLPPYGKKIKDFMELKEWVEITKALIILAHPFRRHDISFDLNVFKPHAVEIASIHIRKENRSKIFELAKNYGLKMVSVSDAHKTKHLGNYCVDLDNIVKDEMELAEEIKGGRFTLMEKVLRPIEGLERNV